MTTTEITAALRQAEIHMAQAREYLTLAHSKSCADGLGLAELATLDLLASARLLEDRVARVTDAVKAAGL